ncbi:transposase, partial [Streptomyces sp. NPDC058661]
VCSSDDRRTGTAGTTGPPPDASSDPFAGRSKYTKRYTAEFKRDAVALVDSTGRTVTEVARELGVSPESLHGSEPVNVIKAGDVFYRCAGVI